MERLRDFSHYCHNCKKNIYFFSSFGKSYLIHLTTNVMFSGQRFAILAMFYIFPSSSVSELFNQTLTFP